MMEWTLRKALPDDGPLIEALFIEMLQTIYQRPDVKGYGPGYLDKFFLGRGDWICVAESMGKVVAFLSIEEHRGPEEYIYLDDLSVSKAYRGHGIGTDLIKAAGQYAKDRNISCLVLHIERSNFSAYRLYKRLGFEKVGEEEHRFKMIKRLVQDPDQ